MKFHKYLIIIFLAAFCSSVSNEVNAQDTEDYEYTREFIWGINKNTNSGLIGGVILKFSRAITPTKFQTIGFEVVNVKHPQEQRYLSNITGNYFKWGKSNSLFSVRGQYGREFILFKKAPQQGIQINAHFSGGPTIGVVAPYFVEIPADNRGSKFEQYNPDNSAHSFSNIMGTGNLFQSLGQANINIGANIKSSLVFEFGTFKNNVTGFEAGFLLEAFPSQVVLVPRAQNNALFSSAFITLFYGSRR